MANLTTVERPNISQFKQNFDHAKDKMFYMVRSGNYPINLILGDKTNSRISTVQVLKGKAGDWAVQQTTFSWLIHSREDYNIDQSMFIGEMNECEQVYSLDVLGVDDCRKKDQMEVMADFRESVTRQGNALYEVGVPWIPRSILSGTNEQPSRRWLANVNKNSSKDRSLKQKYKK